MRMYRIQSADGDVISFATSAVFADEQGRHHSKNNRFIEVWALRVKKSGNETRQMLLLAALTENSERFRSGGELHSRYHGGSRYEQPAPDERQLTLPI